MEIKNVPEYAGKYPYWVFKNVDGEYWFYGAYDRKRSAIAVAEFIGGMVKAVG